MHATNIPPKSDHKITLTNLFNNHHNTQGITWLLTLLIVWIEKNASTFYFHANNLLFPKDKAYNLIPRNLLKIQEYFNYFEAYLFEFENVILSPLFEFKCLKKLMYDNGVIVTEASKAKNSSTSLLISQTKITQPKLEEDPKLSISCSVNNSVTPTNNGKNSDDTITILHVNPKIFARIMTQKIQDYWLQVNISQCIEKEDIKKELSNLRPITDQFIAWIKKEIYSFSNHLEREAAYNQFLIIMYWCVEG